MVLPLLQPATFYRRDFPSLCGLSSDSSYALTENAVLIKYLYLESKAAFSSWMAAIHPIKKSKCTVKRFAMTSKPHGMPCDVVAGIER